MKYIFSILILAAALSLYLRDSEQVKLPAIDLAPRAIAQDKSEVATSLGEDPKLLTETLRQLDRELENAGVPRIFQNENLSESERRHLLAKMNRAAELQAKIVNLQAQRIRDSL